jgi:hypothetical protein
MHLTKPENENYAATVVSIKEVHPLEGCDNVQGTIIFGFQAIVGKDVRPGDMRNDSIVKEEIYEEHIKPRFNVRFVLDDRDRVVKMWRENGLKVLQVAEGDF